MLITQVRWLVSNLGFHYELTGLAVVLQLPVEAATWARDMGFSVMRMSAPISGLGHNAEAVGREENEGGAASPSADVAKGSTGEKGGEGVRGMVVVGDTEAGTKAWRKTQHLLSRYRHMTLNTSAFYTLGSPTGVSNGIGTKWSFSPSWACVALRANLTAAKEKRGENQNKFNWPTVECKQDNTLGDFG